ncbi:hypothetical protein ACSQ67_001397 [Phaseolus vulgaris]
MPIGHHPGASPCDEVVAEPVYGDEGLEVTGGRGIGYEESMGDSPVVGGSVEVADGGELDGVNRSVGKRSVRTVEMVFSAEAAGGKRLGKTLSSSKTNLKNMGKKAAPSSLAGKSPIVCEFCLGKSLTKSMESEWLVCLELPFDNRKSFMTAV